MLPGKTMRKTVLILITLMSLSTLHASAQLQYTDQLKRAADLITVGISSPSVSIDEYFSSECLSALKPITVEDVLKNMHVQYGDALAYDVYSVENNAAVFMLKFNGGMAVPMGITVAATGKITGFTFGLPKVERQSINQLKEQVKSLRGDVGFLLKKIDDTDEVYSFNPDKPLAIGSVFKLYVLASLMDKHVNWATIIRLEGGLKSMPSGDMNIWPDNSPVTLHTLATKMIYESDNTAADHLINYLGRRNMPGLLDKLGNKNWNLSDPFLTTAEAFRLKNSTEAITEYLRLGKKEKYKYLETKVKNLPLYAPNFVTPREITTIEWFASASDICRLMSHFYKGTDALVSDVFAMNPIFMKEPDLTYLAQKGGSEIGVISVAWLFESADKTPYCLAATWNNTADDVDQQQFFKVVKGVFSLNFLHNTIVPQGK